MELGITGRSAMVTDGSKGIGRACVETLLAEGADVCAVSRDVTSLGDLVASSAGHLVTASCGLTSIEGCGRAPQACPDAFGRIDILVNCAGSAGIGNVLEVSSDNVDRALLLKLHGYLRMAQRVAPSMRKRGWGRIINIAGSAGSSPTAPPDEPGKHHGPQSDPCPELRTRAVRDPGEPRRARPDTDRPGRDALHGSGALQDRTP